MKRLQGILVLFLLGMTISAHAGDQEMQADLLLAKISAALNDNRTSEALSYCTTLEKKGPSLEKPLPESFYYYYIEALHRSGVEESILSRAYAYLQRYGKNGPHYKQVAAIISELEIEAMRAGHGDADGAVVAWEESYRIQKEKEHEQTLFVLRSCQSEAIALEGTEKELNVEYEGINAQSDSLLAEKAALDKRVSMIEQGTSEKQKQMRADFNRDSQAYNDAVRAFSRARDLYAAKVEGNNNRRKDYDDRCANLVVLEYDLETVCGQSDDWFCRSLE